MKEMQGRKIVRANASSLDGFMNPCRGIGGSHRKLLDGAGGKLATVATSPADSEESSLGVPEVAPPSSQHRNSITPPSVHAYVYLSFMHITLAFHHRKSVTTTINILVVQKALGMYLST